MLADLLVLPMRSRHTCILCAYDSCQFALRNFPPATPSSYHPFQHERQVLPRSGFMKTFVQRSRCTCSSPNTEKMAPSWLILTIAALAHCQTFNLIDSFQGLDFFNRAFTLYEGFDPTFGYVDYVSLATAEQYGLINLTEVGNTGVARWGVDTTAILDPGANLGRMSVRLQSVKTYTHGLFILDVAHLPANV